MKFSKYQGTGNDFIMLDNRERRYSLTQQLVEAACHRRFGIGADGLIVLENADGYDFRMIYYNADGNEGSMCGNGGRCIVKFAHDLGIFQQSTRFIAIDGEHEATIEGSNVLLRMVDVEGIEEAEAYSFVHTGSPHYVAFVDALSDYNVVEKGRSIRYSDYWQQRGGTNVNFVQQLADNSLQVRTYERGVEDETYSCGTGVTAAALVANRQFGAASPLRINTLGGNLEVHFTPKNSGGFTDIYLAGPALKVFEGVYPIKK